MYMLAVMRDYAPLILAWKLEDLDAVDKQVERWSEYHDKSEMIVLCEVRYNSGLKL